MDMTPKDIKLLDDMGRTYMTTKDIKLLDEMGRTYMTQKILNYWMIWVEHI